MAIAAELKRRGPHVAFHFKRYLSHLLAPVLRERETQVQVLAKDVVSPPEHTDGAESDEVNASLQALDRSLRQVRDHFLLLLFLLVFCCASFCGVHSRC